MRLFADLAVYVVCIAGAYPMGEHAPFLLILLAVSGRASRAFERRRGLAPA